MGLVPIRSLFLCVALIMLAAATIPTAQAQTNLRVWAQVGGIPPTVTLTGVDMVDRNTAWAVGNDRAENGSTGFIYRLSWINDRWTVVEDARFEAPLHKVDAVDAANVWAVGERGLIVRRDANGWQAVSSPVPNASLVSVYMLTANEGWASGSMPSANNQSEGVILHYQNGAWTRDPLISTVGSYSAVTAITFDGGTGWAAYNSNEYRPVGEGHVQQNAVLRYTDGRWTSMPAPDPCGGRTGCSANLTDIAAVNADEPFVVGSTRASCSFCWTGAVATQRRGNEWQPADLPDLYPDAQPHGGTSLYAIDFVDREHGLAVGLTSYGRDGQGFLEGIVLRYTNGQWSRDALPLGSSGLNDVSQIDVDHALAVGSDGRILSYGYGPTELSTPPAPSTGTFAETAFQGVWERSDRPVAANAAGLEPRTWLWGPQPNTAGYREPYAETPGGMRVVQYFDKSRMEITRPEAERNQWYVTNGLLVVEMITGRIQVGDQLFEDRPSAHEAVAGDRIEINQAAPTYSSLVNVTYPNPCERCSKVPRRSGQVVTSVYGNADVTEDPTLARYGVTLDAYEETIGHNIPKVFTDFFAKQGLVYENGRYVRGPLFDWLFVMGLPISEPYWARVKVGGVEKDVLFQAFERRVLTYTPDNAPEWRVEMGNVGQHYLRWRHGR